MNKFEETTWTDADRSDNPTKELYSIGDLAHEFGITTRTIRFYEDKGLISPQRVSGVRAYNKRDRARLVLILRGKRLGFSLEVISEYLALYDADPTQIAQLNHLGTQVTTAIKKLEQQRIDIDHTLDELKEIQETVQNALKSKGPTN